MTLPKQIRDQIENAKQLREQAYASVTETPPESAPAEPTDAPLDESSAAAAPDREPIGTHDNTATPAEDENSPTYAQRWRSLQGVHNSTMQRINSLEQLIAQMQTPPAPARIAQAQPVASLVTDADIDAFGVESVDFTRRVTQEALNPVMQALGAMQRQLESLSGLAPAVKQVAVAQQANAEERFFADLRGRVPDWAPINDNPQFHSWLLAADAMTGITRQTYLVDAQNSLNLDRVVSIFNAWKREAGVPSQVVAPTAQPMKPAASRLEQQVAPGRSNAGSVAPTQKAEKQWSGADIAKFFADKRSGAFKGREAEAAAMERDIFQAQKQGRMALS